MPSSVDAVNIALGHLGSDAQVSSIDPPDGSAEAGNGKRFLPVARREMIEAQEWRFSVKRAPLALLATNPSARWAFAYALPADSIKPRRVLTDRISGGTIFTAPESYPASVGLAANDDIGADFDTEGGILYTNEPDAVLLYQTDVTDFNKWTSSAFSAFCYLLASYMAGPTIRGKAGTSAAQNYRKLGMEFASASMASDANRGQTSWNSDTPQMVSAR